MECIKINVLYDLGWFDNICNFPISCMNLMQINQIPFTAYIFFSKKIPRIKIDEQQSRDCSQKFKSVGQKVCKKNLKNLRSVYTEDLEKLKQLNNKSILNGEI